MLSGKNSSERMLILVTRPTGCTVHLSSGDIKNMQWIQQQQPWGVHGTSHNHIYLDQLPAWVRGISAAL